MDLRHLNDVYLLSELDTLLTICHTLTGAGFGRVTQVS